jgi:hypothetical protein
VALVEWVVWYWIQAELTTVPATVKPLVFAGKVGKAAGVGVVTELKGVGSATDNSLAVFDDNSADVT